MSESVSALYASEEVDSLVRAVDTERVAQTVGARGDEPAPKRDTAIARLRVAAVVATTEALGSRHVEELLDGATQSDIAAMAFQQWEAYFDATDASRQQAATDELVLFACAALMSQRPNELRSILNRATLRAVVDDAEKRALDWGESVRTRVSAALLLIVRQRSRDDIARAGAVIERLAQSQRQLDGAWLESQQDRKQHSALKLLGYYHLAQAVIRTSEFLLAGSVATPTGKRVADFAPELKRLLVRAEEYFGFIGDPELDVWLRALVVIIWRSRSDSIWVQARGISARLDELLNALTGADRPHPIFSLLPSQQDALRQHLLDPAQVAVILQMPTSAGKTLLAEFSIVQAFQAYQKDARAIYVCPTRALATQVRRTLLEDLRPLGINVAAAGSAFEDDPFELKMLEDSDGVVVATPEKLDLLLRAHPDWTESLRLVVVDEAHLLRDSERGVRLELLLANLRREVPQARLLLLTPFVQNASELATWLGGTKGIPISVQWRPTRTLLGIVSKEKDKATRATNLVIKWNEPHRGPRPSLGPLRFAPDLPIGASTAKVTSYLGQRLSDLGSTLVLCSANKTYAEDIAASVATTRHRLETTTANLRIAIALARDDYGEDSLLAKCLERGVAFHHSSLSPTLRYLIEDQIRAHVVTFGAATTTLAQGMNFPVASVIVHSVHKPYGGGDLSPAEFWNIAGRAGRVGMVDRGLVIFASPGHQDKLAKYTQNLSEDLRSALLAALQEVNEQARLKDQYRENVALRPFFQYLVHAVAARGHAAADAELEELLSASLAAVQAGDTLAARRLRNIARRYLAEIAGRQQGYLKIADETGLGSFSFDELYAKIASDAVLQSGPGEVLRRRHEGMEHLVEALRWLPELDLAIGYGPGRMDVPAVARVIQGWLEGSSIATLAREFPGKDDETRTRRAGEYLNGKVSQIVAWGAHAYLRGWGMRAQGKQAELPSADAMLPAYIQYGVRTPEAAVAALLGVPRQFAEPMANTFRGSEGPLKPENAVRFKEFVEKADERTWASAVSGSRLRNIAPADLRAVWRQMQGIS